MQSDILFIILLLKAVSNLPFLQYLFTDLVDKGLVGLPAGSQGWNRIDSIWRFVTVLASDSGWASSKKDMQAATVC